MTVFLSIERKPCLHLLKFVADDHQDLIWDIQPMPQPIEVPILAYAAEGSGQLRTGTSTFVASFYHYLNCSITENECSCCPKNHSNLSPHLLTT